MSVKSAKKVAIIPYDQYISLINNKDINVISTAGFPLKKSFEGEKAESLKGAGLSLEPNRSYSFHNSEAKSVPKLNGDSEKPVKKPDPQKLNILHTPMEIDTPKKTDHQEVKLIPPNESENSFKTPPPPGIPLTKKKKLFSVQWLD